MKTIWLAALAWAAWAGPAAAHDTWFRLLARPQGSAMLALGTGTRYPAQQFPVGLEHLQRSGCEAADGAAAQLLALQQARNALLLRAQVPAAACWAQLAPVEIELGPQTVAVYLDEIHAPDAVRAAWGERQTRGLGWKERYTKHARIELGTAPPVSGARMDMDILLDTPPRAAQALALRVLRLGRPLAGLPVELVGEAGQSAGWALTDAEGRASLTPPQPGRWLLRGTWLQPMEGDAAWESGFVTLSFEAGA